MVVQDGAMAGIPLLTVTRAWCLPLLVKFDKGSVQKKKKSKCKLFPKGGGATPKFTFNIINFLIKNVTFLLVSSTIPGNSMNTKYFSGSFQFQCNVVCVTKFNLLIC